MTEHYRVREAKPLDASAIFSLVQRNNYVSRSLPQHQWLLEFRIKTSNVFVLEEMETGAIVGTASIRDLPLRLVYQIEESDCWNALRLVLIKEKNAKEFRGLLLDERVRGKGFGRLLSHSRLCYLALQENRETEYIIASLPCFYHRAFWNFIGEKVFGMSYDDAERRLNDWEFMEASFEELPARVCLPVFLKQTLVSGPGAPMLTPSAHVARLLLQAVGFTYLRQIEIDGAAWYGNSFQRVLSFMRHVHPRDIVVTERECGEGLRRKVIVTSQNDAEGFTASYAPVVVSPTGHQRVFIRPDAFMRKESVKQDIFIFP